jgi:hypothetical protein
MPDWELQAVPVAAPAEASDSSTTERVRIRQWVHEQNRVRVEIVQYQSDEEAIKALQQFALDKKTNNMVTGLGDEAYIWGIRNAIAFRRGNLTIQRQFEIRNCSLILMFNDGFFSRHV